MDLLLLLFCFLSGFGVLTCCCGFSYVFFLVLIAGIWFDVWFVRFAFVGGLYCSFVIVAVFMGLFVVLNVCLQFWLMISFDRWC